MRIMWQVAEGAERPLRPLQAFLQLPPGALAHRGTVFAKLSRFLNGKTRRHSEVLDTNQP